MESNYRRYPSGHGSSNTGSSFGDRTNEHQNAASVSAQDQMLLKAFQAFIVPFIRIADRRSMDETNQILLGPEAGKLITALQEFISSIVIRSESKYQNAIEVSLIEGENETNSDDESREDYFGVDHGSPNERLDEWPSPLARTMFRESQTLNRYIAPKESNLTFQERLRKSLREYIFNKMPIRLLHFEPHGSSIRITLLEREDIYARIESALPPYMGSGFTTMETDQQVIERVISNYARYAILSHTWLQPSSDEVTYSNWINGLYNVEGPGYRKLVNFCKTVWNAHGQLTFGWMDTVCINKESSSELDESIRSMYDWYSHAHVCITYLAESGTLLNMHEDRWFKRGWTLQELVASRVIYFYNGKWKPLGEYSRKDKKVTRVTKQIERATTISVQELYDISQTPISRRMQLAADRQVTREEDTAYSLMGIFNVSISTAYGEGAERAFFRLLREILDFSEGVLDIFNWAGELPNSRVTNSLILPTSPRLYTHRSSDHNLLLKDLWPLEPLILTHQGLRVPVILMPGVQMDSPPSRRFALIGDYTATARVIFAGGPHANRETAVYLLVNKIGGPDGRCEGWSQSTLAVLNIEGDATSIRIPKTCLAIWLHCNEDAGKVSASGDIAKFPTVAPIVFELKKARTFDENNFNNNDASEDGWYRINRDELAKHGMQLVTLYL